MPYHSLSQQSHVDRCRLQGSLWDPEDEDLRGRGSYPPPFFELHVEQKWSTTMLLGLCNRRFSCLRQESGDCTSMVDESFINYSKKLWEFPSVVCVPLGALVPSLPHSAYGYTQTSSFLGGTSSASDIETTRPFLHVFFAPALLLSPRFFFLTSGIYFGLLLLALLKCRCARVRLRWCWIMP